MPKSKRARLLVENTFLGIETNFWINFPVLNGNSSLEHDHDFAEIVLIGGGQGRHVSIFGEEELSCGDCLILTPGAWHAYRDCTELQVANCCFRPANIVRELGIIMNVDALAGFLYFSSGVSPARLHLDRTTIERAFTHLRSLEALQWQEEKAARLEAGAHFLLLLGLISRSLSEHERQVWSRAARWPVAIRESVVRLEGDLARDWTLGELATAAHLDPAYFVRLFKSAVGEPPLHYLTRRRAELAGALLLSTSLSISEIGMRVGWATPAYFARRFRLHFGMSAREFRLSKSHP
jgi:AraC family L-rhamnose operon transcriptional activator RhaR